MINNVYIFKLFGHKFATGDPGVWRCQLKFVEVVNVADVDDEDRVGKILLQIW